MSQEERIAELEELVRACKRLEWAMYNSDLEASWPRDAYERTSAYKDKYGVDLDEGAYED